MNELIKITNQNGIETVNARELHGFLESKRQFSNWIRNRIEKYGFVENVDFVCFNKFVKAELNSYGNRTYKEYYLSIDMAKELSMIENNEKGRQARRYFIECEKKLIEGKVEPKPQYIPTEYEIEQQKLRKAELLKEIADQYDGKSKQILHAYATKALEDHFLLPLPEQKKTYSASEIGEMFGVSSNKIGKISNQYNLKVDKYGEWFRDKSKYSDKEVSTFRYYAEVIPEIKKILKEEGV